MLTSQTFPLVVDYTLCLMEMIEVGCYDAVELSTLQIPEPDGPAGVATVGALLIQPPHLFADTNEVLENIERQNARPATFAELLALGYSPAGLTGNLRGGPRERRIVALGTQVYSNDPRVVSRIDYRRSNFRVLGLDLTHADHGIPRSWGSESFLAIQQ